MPQFMIMCRSLTNAQRCVKILEKSGIGAALVKAPTELSGDGCRYAVRLNSLEKAVQILRKNNLSFGKVYRRDGKAYTEVSV